MAKPTGADQLRETLQSLKLDCMADTVEALCEQAAKEAWPYATFLTHLLNEELSAREHRRLTVTTKMARLPFHKLIDQISQDAQRGQLLKRMQQLCKPRVLILDEMGYLPLERPIATFLFQLVAKRYEKGAIIPSSNKSFSEWGDLFTDQVLATALLDRRCITPPDQYPGPELSAQRKTTIGSVPAAASTRDDHC